MRMRLLFASVSLALFVCTPLANAQSNTETYEYDALGRLIVATTGEGEKTEYDLDGAGNREEVAASDMFSTAWEAESLPKVIGTNVVGDNAGAVRQATPSDGAGHMTYGPYTTGLPSGDRVAAWRIKIDSADPNDTTAILFLDIYDATAGEFLGTHMVRREDFIFSNSFQVFEIPFGFESSRVGHSIEFRSWSYAQATVSIDKIGYR